MARDCLRHCKSPRPENLSLVIGASDRVTLPEIDQEMNKGMSLQSQSPPQTSSEQRAACGHCADWRSKAYCPGGYRLHANRSTQAMLSDVGEKEGPLASSWREFVNVLWRECGPNWYRQWTFSHCTSSGCRWGSAEIWSATWAECDQTTRWNGYVWHRWSEISSARKTDVCCYHPWRTWLSRLIWWGQACMDHILEIVWRPTAYISEKQALRISYP